MSVFINGFLCGLAYVCPIGMQNSFVINNALKNKTGYSYVLSMITTLFDVLLAVACFYGIGYVFEIFPQYKKAFMTLGGIFVLFMGIMIMFSKGKEYETNDIKTKSNIYKDALKILGVTWINPQGIIDGSIFLGSFRVMLTRQESIIFIIGVAIASAIWFLTLTTIVTVFRKKMNSKIITYINIVCGGIIILFGIKILFLY